jgi:hypothetical protein
MIESKVGYKIKELAAMGPLSEWSIREAIRLYAQSVADGRKPEGLRAVKHGKFTVVLTDDWRNFLAGLPAITVADLRRWSVKQIRLHEAGVAA